MNKNSFLVLTLYNIILSYIISLLTKSLGRIQHGGKLFEGEDWRT